MNHRATMCFDNCFFYVSLERFSFESKQKTFDFDSQSKSKIPQID